MAPNKIRYFLVLCEERNFIRAAKRCAITQPSLSNAIQSLEKEMGGRLFTRKPVVRLSPLGELVRPHLEQALRALESARNEATRHHVRKLRAQALVGATKATVDEFGDQRLPLNLRLAAAAS
jgi:DNA-binding transcriptional LysR family regulator